MVCGSATRRTELGTTVPTERKVRVSVIEVVGGLWSQLFVHFTMRWILLGERPTRPDHECDCGERDHYFSRIHCDILLHEIPGCEAAVN
jgi:hypothetical protein